MKVKKQQKRWKFFIYALDPLFFRSFFFLPLPPIPYLSSSFWVSVLIFFFPPPRKFDSFNLPDGKPGVGAYLNDLLFSTLFFFFFKLESSSEIAMLNIN